MAAVLHCSAAMSRGSLMDALTWQFVISSIVFIAMLLFVRSGWRALLAFLQRQEQRYHKVLVHDLLIDIHPRVALGLAITCVLGGGVMGYLATANIFGAMILAGLGALLPQGLTRYLEQRRRDRLNEQLVDGITTLASGVRAGLTIVQSIELLAHNSTGPIKQEFEQLMREYQMGLDLNQAMRNTAARIGSPNYRLLFTAIEMHRLRGGDMGESLDRIAESIRELQRLEGKLDALTAQGRYQAWLMAAMPLVFLGLLYLIDAQGVRLMFMEPLGRILMMASMALIAVGYFWIRRIMAVDV